MTPQEFEYIQRAMKALESPMSPMQRIKVQRTMAQILEGSAQKQENDFCELVDANLYRQYQDLQNQKLVDLLSK